MNRYSFNEEKHIHSLYGKPLIGTTTALSIISKELTWWASGMACAEFGWLNPKKHTKEECLQAAEKGLRNINSTFCPDAGVWEWEEWNKFLNRAYRAHHDFKEKRAGEGTDLHELAEQWIGTCLKENGGRPDEPLLVDLKLKQFVEWCLKNVKRFLFSEIHCYSERLWVGGKTDFGYEDSKGNYILADIKSRDQDYFSDHVQCGGYDIQLIENGGFDKDGNRLWPIKERFYKHAIFTLGDKFKEPVFSEPTENRKAFEYAIGLYKLKQAYDLRP